MAGDFEKSALVIKASIPNGKLFSKDYINSCDCVLKPLIWPMDEPILLSEYPGASGIVRIQPTRMPQAGSKYSILPVTLIPLHLRPTIGL